jgi:hypothetical protein
MTKASARRSSNNQLATLCSTYHRAIPVSAMFEACRPIGEVVQEDGTPWSGFLCGHQGRASLAIDGSKSMLVFTWYRMPSGNFEVVAYVS